MEFKKTQVVIIGGGIIGCAVARELSRYKLSVVLVEKEEDVGFGTTKANSGIVHAGFHDKPGTLKATYCYRGNTLYPALCEELDVNFKQNGIMMVAKGPEEEEIVKQYAKQGRENGVAGLRVLTGDEARTLEPNLSTEVTAALLAENGGVVAPFELAMALMENARQNGVEFLLGERVDEIIIQGDIKRVKTSNTVIEAEYLVNAAGLYADEIANMLGDPAFSILPRKGEEYLLDKSCGDKATRTIFPTPKEKSKGILVIPTVDGNLMIGPTGDDVADKGDIVTTSEGFDRIFAGASRLISGIPANLVIAPFAGVRAASCRKDFIVELSKKVPKVLHLAGMESPGLTAAPAIAEAAVGLLGEAGLSLVKNENFIPKRDPVIRFHSLSPKEQDALVKENPLYGRVICRCETVTEGEIVDAIQRGAKTLDGVKFRVRAGAGRCQGGFCMPLVMKILARELRVPLTAITKRGAKTEQIPYQAKDFYGKEEEECASCK